jgi:hypothetical protein
LRDNKTITHCQAVLKKEDTWESVYMDKIPTKYGTQFFALSKTFLSYYSSKIQKYEKV